MVVSMKCRSFFIPEAYIALTPVHWFYLVGGVGDLIYHDIAKRYSTGLHRFPFWDRYCWKMQFGRGIQTIFSSIIYAISEFREVIATIALVTAFSKCIQELGSDALLMRPVSKVMRTPAVSWWILGGIMFVFSLFYGRHRQLHW